MRADRAGSRFELSRLFWIGASILLLGSGPLLLTILAAAVGLTSDPNPNPVGFGIMAMFTFWPGVILTLAGLIQSIVRYRAESNR